MTFQPNHFALYFNEAQVVAAKQADAKAAAIQTAWTWLKAEPSAVIHERKETDDTDAVKVIKHVLNPLGEAMEAAFRYRFLGGASAGEKAFAILDTAFTDKSSLFETLTETIAHAQIFEMLRPIYPEKDKWLKNFAAFSHDLQKQEATADSLDKLWLITLKIVAGVLLEDAASFEEGAKQFRLAIDELIHPEGYIKPIVEGAKEATPTFRKMLLGVGALSLAAEAAYHVGLDLWAYERRDVGMNTAASYLVYYYYYPDKWRWGIGLTETDTHAIFREYGAFIEILTSHLNPRGVELLLDEQRPFFSPIMGGLTTLSHFKTEKRRRGWFGF